MDNKLLSEKDALGKRIQSIRENRKLSLVQLSRLSGITRVTLAEIEKGTANPGIDSIIRICNALKITLSDLFSSRLVSPYCQAIMQPFNGSLFSSLSAALTSGEYSSFQFLVAYAKSSGVDLLTDSIHSFRNKGGIVEAYVGIDQKNTTADSLYKLLHLCDSLYVVHDRAFAQTYHPKLYLLSNRSSSWLAIGSGNLTRGGLFTNYEATIIQLLDLTAYSDAQLYETIASSLQEMQDHSLVRKINSVEDISALLREELVVTEQTSRMGVRKSFVTNSGGFGHRSVTTIPEALGKIPVPAGIFSQNGARIAAHAPTTDYHKHVEDGDSLVTTQALLEAERSPDLMETCWFYAGKLTGGSRNILDLSEKARLQYGNHPDAINKTIPGGVAFFGIDPKNHSAQKDITILYNGIRYFPSTVKYAPGNSNWRVQLKGAAETGGKLLSQFGEDFVNHILIFHKLTDDCYILETMISEEMVVLKKSSRFWATNGRTNSGRPFGIL